jgi:hypothetical protein
MLPDSFVQRLVNYSTSCRLIREWISTLTDGRRYDLPLVARRRADSLTRGKPRPMSRRVTQSMTWPLFKAGEDDDKICPIRSVAGETG